MTALKSSSTELYKAKFIVKRDIVILEEAMKLMK